MSISFSDRADALLRVWLSQDDCFMQTGEGEDKFWEFVVAMLQDFDRAGERLTIIEIDRRVRQACQEIRGESGTDEVAIYRLVSQIESVYCFLDAQRGVAHQKEPLS